MCGPLKFEWKCIGLAAIQWPGSLWIYHYRAVSNFELFLNLNFYFRLCFLFSSYCYMWCEIFSQLQLKHNQEMESASHTTDVPTVVDHCLPNTTVITIFILRTEITNKRPLRSGLWPFPYRREGSTSMVSPLPPVSPSVCNSMQLPLVSWRARLV